MLKKTLAGSLLALAMPIASVAVGAGPASAEIVITDCSTSSVRDGIARLQDEVSALAITGQNAEMDRTGLLGKLSAALTKLDQGKTADAAAKLDDFRTKVLQLRDADKISAADADRLVAAADQLIACLAG